MLTASTDEQTRTWTYDTAGRPSTPMCAARAGPSPTATTWPRTWRGWPIRTARPRPMPTMGWTGWRRGAQSQRLRWAGFL